MKRVLHITYDMGIGGTEQVINQLIRGMDKSEVDHRICCIEGAVGAIGQALQQDGINIDIFTRQPGFDWSLIKGIRKLLKAYKIDILHCHQYTPWVYGWFAALGMQTKVIFTEHGRFYPDKHRYKARLLNKLMAASTYKITAISKATKAALVEYEFIPEHKIEVIYNGIEPLNSSEQDKASARLELGITQHQRVIGTVARLDPIKNQRMLIEAFAMLAPDFPELVLLIVGDGPERGQLEQLSKDLRIIDRIIFTGFKSPATNYMALMELFLLPSLSEGTSMTLLEAMSLGIPCIVSDVGGNPEVVAHNRNGLVVELTKDSLKDAILQIINNPVLMQKMVNENQSVFMKKFCRQAMIYSMNTLYENII